MEEKKSISGNIIYSKKYYELNNSKDVKSNEINKNVI